MVSYIQIYFCGDYLFKFISMVTLISIYFIFFNGQLYLNLFPWSALFKFIYFISMFSFIQIYFICFHGQFYLNLFPWQIGFLIIVV